MMDTQLIAQMHAGGSGGFSYTAIGLPLIFAVAICALVAFGRRGRLMVLAGGIAGVLATIAIPAFVRYRALESRPVYVNAIAPNRATSGGSGAPAVLAWSFDASPEFNKAGVYPSARAAAKGLAYQLDAWLDASFISDDARINVQAPAGGDDVLAAAVMQVLNHRIAGRPKALQAEAETRPVSSAGDDVVVTIMRASAHSAGGSQEPSSGGTVVIAAASGSRALFHSTARYVDKPWADNPDEYASRRRDKAWIVGYSPEFATARDAAEWQALQDAGGKVLARREFRELLSLPHRKAELEFELRNLTAGQLEAAGVVGDRFVQSFERPYGKVWRAAVLVDGSPKAVSKVARSVSSVIHAERVSWWKTLGAGAGMFVVILVAYLFLNVATKGYYVGALRVAAVLGIGAVIWIVLSAS